MLDVAKAKALKSANGFRGQGDRARRYAFRKVSRSALMVSASVVGMPCGKPL